jgi:hypothetical protein
MIAAGYNVYVRICFPRLARRSLPEGFNWGAESSRPDPSKSWSLPWLKVLLLTEICVRTRPK